MTHKVFYFTGTGNSLMIAKILGEQLSAELIPITKAIEIMPDINDNEIIGIIFPIYFFGLPKILINFIEKLPINSDAYYFAVSNCGSMYGPAFLQLDKLLKKRGGVLHNGFNIRMPDNYLPFLNPPNEIKQREIITRAKKTVLEIIPKIEAKEIGSLPKSNILINLFGVLFYQVVFRNFKTADKNFWSNDDCISCSICEQICPVKNIEMVKGKPHWLNNCEHCLACLHWCPKSAIQFGQVSLKRRRYHNPEISVKEVIL